LLGKAFSRETQGHHYCRMARTARQSEWYADLPGKPDIVLPRY
jgi:hypothetical protein